MFFQFPIKTNIITRLNLVVVEVEDAEAYLNSETGSASVLTAAT